MNNERLLLAMDVAAHYGRPRADELDFDMADKILGMIGPHDKRVAKATTEDLACRIPGSFETTDGALATHWLLDEAKEMGKPS